MSDDKEKELPWLVNKSNDDDSLKTAINEDESLREESEFLSAIRENMQSQNIPTPGELGLARLKRNIAEADKKTGTPFSGFNRWARPALAAALVVVVLQSALLIDQSSDIDGNYQPLSGEVPSENKIQISFKDGASELQLRNAINLTGGTIIDGPGELGIYIIALDNDADIENITNILTSLDYVDNVVEN